MATVPQDVDSDIGPIYDDNALEVELRNALKSEPEIELFKVINKAMRVKDELANNDAIKAILQDQWRTVAEFFDRITEAPTIARLAHDDELVVLHKDMQANFRAVAAVNSVFKDAQAAESQVLAYDQMSREQENAEI